MRNLAFKPNNGKIYVKAMSLYFILLACHGQMEWRMMLHGQKKCPCLLNTSQIAYSYVKIDYRLTKIERVNYRKETPSLARFNLVTPLQAAKKYRMKLLTRTSDNQIMEIGKSVEFKNSSFKHDFNQTGTYKLSFQFKICRTWSIETIKHVKIVALTTGLRGVSGIRRNCFLEFDWEREKCLI
ncbi:uncharacterized protein LOC135924702 isoform X1 [Gordionus sp. m RMFG-2023]|uniref:uncharacterized protein LOC135924702 isoform X1 n=1 Tax=Gordionus sp. m RMFG-2023 TaxID=3053472 RepID=UPI0031FC30FF